MTRSNGVALLDVVVLLVTVALLLAVAVPELSAARQRSLERAMRADLMQLAAAEESYFYDHRVYSGDPMALQAVGYRPSDGTRIVVREATVAGWSAVASRIDTPVRCGLFVRHAAPVGAARTPGVPACR